MTAPQGYLTLDPASPIILRDCTGSILHYTPTTAGNSVPVVDSAGALQPLSIVAAALASPPSLSVSRLPAGSMHDIYAVDHSGFALARVPWVRSNPFGSRSFGDGPFCNPISPPASDASYFGTPVNSLEVTGYLSDGTSITIPQYSGTYLGSVCISSTVGVIKCLGTYGLSREWGVWNAHQQRPIEIRAGDPAFHWGTGPALPHSGRMVGTETEYYPSMGPIFGDANNSAKTFVGRATRIDMRWRENVYRLSTSGHVATVDIGIGWNSTTTTGGSDAGFNTEGGTSDGLAIGGASEALRTELSAPGVNTAYMLVQTQGVVSGGTALANGSSIAVGSQEVNQLLSVKWMG